MPTESSRVNHNSGPPSLGQSSQPASRLPQQHPQQQIPPYGQQQQQLNQSRGLAPQHPQQLNHNHAPNRNIPPNSMPYGGAQQIRQIPITQQNPAVPPQLQQQSARAVPQYFPNGYLNNDYSSPIPGQPPSYMNHTFMYPTQFFPMQPPPSGPPHAPPPAQNQNPINGARAPRPFHQPVHNAHPMQRGPAPPNSIPIPRRTKKVMAIVDPNTNQAIKVEKVATPSTSKTTPKPPPAAIKIEPRTARPLSLQSDPADSKSSSQQQTNVGEKGAKTSETETAHVEKAVVVDGGKNTMEASVQVTTDELKAPLEEAAPKPADVTVEHSKISSVSSKPAERTVSEEDVSTSAVAKEVSLGAEPSVAEGNSVSKPKPTEGEIYERSVKSNLVSSNKADDNLDGMTSDVSSSTFADVRSDSTDGPMPNLTHKPSDEQQSSTAKVLTETSEEKSQSQKSLSTCTEKKTVDETTTANGTKSDDTPVPQPDQKVLIESTDASDKSKAEVKEDASAKTGPAGEKSIDESGESEDANGINDSETEEQDDGFGPMTFKEGERRVFPPAWMMSMQQYANTKKVNEILPALGNQISKSMKRSSSRDSHSDRGGSGIMNQDPRRRRAFPSPGSFQMPPIGGGAIPVRTSAGSDSFNLGIARDRKPPMSKPPSRGDGDPRGTRTQGGRHDGPVRSSHMPIDPFVQPVEKLKRSENAWKRDRDCQNETARKVSEVRSLLNKLTLEKFDKIFQQIVDIDISSMETLIGIVKEIFEKPLYEPKFSSMYAELCKRLDLTIQPILDKKDPEGQFNFRKILLNNCKEEFIRFANSNANKDSDSSKDAGGEEKTDAQEKEPTASEKEEEQLKATKAKRRMLANVRFIGELYLKDLLRGNIIHKNCIQKLLHLASETFEEDVLEAVCKLISKTGAKLSANANAADYINRYFNVLIGMSTNSRVPARIRFMIQDLVEQRNNGWKVRREEVGAKTIAEIHKDIAEKEKAKQEAASALRDRKQRTQSSRMHGDRGGMSSQPRIAMTMATASKGSSSGMSRTNMLLERGLNRSSGNSSAPLQSMRLGPGGKSGLGSSTGGPSLRPRSMSGSRFSALGSDTQDRNSGNSVSGASNLNASGTDVRRSKLAPSNKLGAPRRAMSARPSLTDMTPAPPKPMELSALKKKTKAILEEYLDIELLDEFTGCMEDEIQKHNYPAFVESLIKVTMEGKRDTVPKTQNLLQLLITSGKLEASLFLSGFKKYGPELQNIEVDYPLATELYSGLVAAVASTDEFKQLSEGGKFGVGFVRKIFTESTEKNGVGKLVLMTCKAAMEWEKRTKDETEAKRLAQEVFDSLDVDLPAEYYQWDSMFGPKLLNTALSRTDMNFLIPSFESEIELRSILERNPLEESVFNILSNSKLDLTDKKVGVDMVRTFIRVALDIVFSEGSDIKSKLETVLKACVGRALCRAFKETGDSSNMPRELQFETVVAVQSYFSRNESKIPSTIGEEQSATTVFMVLYDGDLVEEEVFRMWKDDTKVSVKGAGKEKMLVDTSRFFKWLDEAEEE